MARYLWPWMLLGLGGCGLLPQVAHQPTLHNPFPQLSRVAVAPFFNLSHEPTLNGRNVAMAYANELQLVPGFEVVPVGVVEQAIQQHRLALRGPEDARRLAQLLEVDAVVIGAVTDYTPYYPPRMGLEVQWFAANPGFHPVPPGYGLPWGTPGEQDIPAPVVFEAEMALAKAQMKTQSPEYQPSIVELPPEQGASEETSRARDGSKTVRPLAHEQAKDTAPAQGVLPPEWPDPRGFVPPPPGPRPKSAQPSLAPVMQHTKTYNGHDADFTQALASYHNFRDDERLNGWQGYLQRSDDFVRFCCHMHLWEMLSARGGAGESRVVWRWPGIR